jgi:hypothetical protein
MIITMVPCEFSTSERQICYSSPGIAIIPKGSMGKTGDRLVGCFVPVICYPTDIVLGHFSPLKTARAQELLKCACGTDTPRAIYVYRNKLDRNSYWTNRADEYFAHLEAIKEVIEQITRVPAAEIEVRQYASSSEVVVDWTAGHDPVVFAQPYTQG